MNTITEADLIDYLAGELSPEHYRRVRDALHTDARLREELEILQLMREELCRPEDLAPSPAADRRFAELLAAEPDPVAVRRPLHPLRHWAVPLIGVAASLLLVFGLGWYSGRSGATEVERELAATRTLMLELMQDASSTTRMRAATVSLEVGVADPVVIANLGRMLRNDENTNVRLAALDALQRFAAEPAAREEMLAAMDGNPPPAVQVQLMETLVRLRERRVLPYLEELIRNDSIPRPLRDAAELGTFKLI